MNKSSPNFFIKLSISVYHGVKHSLNGIVLLFDAIFDSENLNKRIKKQKLKKLEKIEQEKIDVINKRIALRNKEIKEIKIKYSTENEIKKSEKRLQKLQKKLEHEQLLDKELLSKQQKIKDNKINKLKSSIDVKLANSKKDLASEKDALANEKQMRKLEKYRQKQIVKQQQLQALEDKKIEEKNKKLELEEERKNRLKRRNDEEVFKEVNVFNSRLKSLPETIKEFFLKKYNNLSFVKNIKNKRDINRQALILSFEGDDAKKSTEKITYQYVAKNPKGKIVRETFDAYSKAEVHSFLLSEGYEVYSIKTSTMIQLLNSNISSTKIKMKDLVFILTQLSTYIKSGISLVESLKILTRQYKKKSYQRIFRSLMYDLTMGDSFSKALEKQSKSFPRLLVNMVKASELTGDLPETLDDMAEYYTETEKTRKEMITAMMYPTIILIVAVAALSFIMIYIVPKFVEIYESMDAAQIPGITLAVLAFSNFMQKYYVLIFLIIAGIILINWFFYKVSKNYRRTLQWIGMHLPIFGNIIIYNEVTMFTKTFSSLLKHNVFITDSMEILNTITANEIYRALIFDTIDNLAKGEIISLAFADNWAFPVPAYEMIVTGEKTGKLAEMMEKVADYYQELHSNLIARMKTFIEPVLIIFMTVVVGVIIISIVVPMFNIYSVVEMQ